MNVSELGGMVKKLIPGETNSDDFMGGAGFIVACGPPLLGDVNVDTLKVIGLLQSANIDSSRNVSQASELGSHSKILLTDRGNKSQSFSRLVTIQANALKQLYSYVTKNESLNLKVPQGNHWTNLDHELFQHPIGLYLRGYTTNKETIMSQYLENVLIGNESTVSNERQRGIIENFTIAWANTMYIAITSSGGV